MHERHEVTSLSCIRIGDGCADTWADVELPTGPWDSSAYLFAYSGYLYAVLIAADRQGNYQIYRRLSADHNAGEAWHFVTELPERKFMFGIAVVGDSSLVVAGGCIGLASDPVFTVHIFDLNTTQPSTNDGWTCLPNLPSHCLQPHIVAPAVDAGQIHLFGYGCLHGDDGAVQTLSIDRSTAEPKWSYGVITDPHLRRAAVSSMNGYLVTSGGYNGKGPSAPSDHVNMHIQCETSQQWLPISSLVTARYGARLLSADNTLIVVGGFRGTDTNAAIVREIEVLRAMW